MKKMILDLDTGVDDALAISYALGSPEIELIGITGTYGNVLVEQGVRNALAVTDLLGHPEVKVYQGLPHSSTTDHFEVLPISAFIHGDNGIGDVEIPDSNRSVETESAVDFIIDAVKTYGKDLVYVPTGPMTNIEAALKKAPEIKDEIGQIVLMGGALTVPGNCNACMEANISQDPEAADYLFRSGAPTTMIGLDVTLQTLLTYKETQQWRDLGTKAGKFLADMTDFYIKAYETTSPHLGGCGLHDPLAVGVAVSRQLKVMRFGDNMREVAVTEGDKVEGQARLGWQVNTWAVGDLVQVMNEVTDAEIDALMEVYRASYDFATDDIGAIRYQAREEIAIKKMLDAEGCQAFSNTFQDLYGMEQLPGLASQHLMAQGYGYGGEGDWKVAAMTAILKAMGEGGNGCSLFCKFQCRYSGSFTNQQLLNRCFR